jgi:hypothetical protein
MSEGRGASMIEMIFQYLRHAASQTFAGFNV